MDGVVQMQMGVDIRKPFTAERQAIARLTLKQRWEAKGGAEFTEKVTDREDSYSIDWISTNG